MPTGYPEAPGQKPISMPSLEEHTLRLLKIKALGTRFVDFWSQCEKVIESNFLGLVARLLEPRPESRQIEPRGIRFVDYWSQGQRVIKSRLLGMVLSTSGAKARKSLNRGSWDEFCRLLGPRPESH